MTHQTLSLGKYWKLVPSTLNPDYVADRSLRSLRDKNTATEKNAKNTVKFDYRNVNSLCFTIITSTALVSSIFLSNYIDTIFNQAERTFS